MVCAVQDAKRQQEAARKEQEAAATRWSREREGLQRQVRVVCCVVSCGIRPPRRATALRGVMPGAPPALELDAARAATRPPAECRRACLTACRRDKTSHVPACLPVCLPHVQIHALISMNAPEMAEGQPGALAAAARRSAAGGPEAAAGTAEAAAAAADAEAAALQGQLCELQELVEELQVRGGLRGGCVCVRGLQQLWGSLTLTVDEACTCVGHGAWRR